MAKTLSLAGDNETILSAALEGLEIQRQRIETQIAQVRAALGTSTRPTRLISSSTTAGSSRRRNLSEAARKRIAMAQKKRWAEYRKKQAGATS